MGGIVARTIRDLIIPDGGTQFKTAISLDGADNYCQKTVLPVIL